MLKDYFARPFTIDRIGRILSIITIIVLLGWIFGFLYTLLIPFILACVTAQLLIPVVRFFQYKVRLRNRAISVIVVLLLFVGIVTGVIALLVPSIQSESAKAWELLTYYAKPELFLSIFPEAIRDRVGAFFEKRTIFESMKIEDMVNYLKKIFDQGWSLVSSTLTFIMGLTQVFVYLIYLFLLLSEYEGLSKGLLHLFPKSQRLLAKEIGQNIDMYVNKYFRGQGLIALIVGIFMATGFSIMGLPLGITCGLLIGFLNLVPYMQLLGIPPIIILCLLQSASTGQNVWILFLIAFGILGLCQVMQDIYLTPKIMGKQMGMSPAIILLSLTIWGKIAGLMGLLFGLPMTMILYTLYMKYVIDEPITDSSPDAPESKTAIPKEVKFSGEEQKTNTES